MNKSGIALLVVIMCLSTFMIVTIAMYQAALLFPRFVQNEIKQQKNELLLDGALTYAIMFCRENWQQLVIQARQGKKEETFSLPLPDDTANAIIVITLGKDQQKITVTIVQNNKKGATSSAVIHNDLSVTHL